MNVIIKILLILFLAAGIGCSSAGEAPFIKLKQLPYTTIDDTNRDLNIILTYFDEDGDLESGAIFVGDSREPLLTSTFPFPQFDSVFNSPIKGSIPVTLIGVTKFDSAATSEFMRFNIYISDKLGNQSNLTFTEWITIK